MNNFDNNADLPTGLKMALSENTDAMSYFNSLTRQHKREVIDRTHTIQSSQEMRDFVSLLSKNHLSG